MIMWITDIACNLGLLASELPTQDFLADSGQSAVDSFFSVENICICTKYKMAVLQIMFQ